LACFACEFAPLSAFSTVILSDRSAVEGAEGPAFGPPGYGARTSSSGKTSKSSRLNV
jgi:hypothetical protein